MFVSGGAAAEKTQDPPRRRAARFRADSGSPVSWIPFSAAGHHLQLIFSHVGCVPLFVAAAAVSLTARLKLSTN